METAPPWVLRNRPSFSSRSRSRRVVTTETANLELSSSTETEPVSRRFSRIAVSRKDCLSDRAFPAVFTPEDWEVENECCFAIYISLACLTLHFGVHPNTKAAVYYIYIIAALAGYGN